MLKPRDSTVKYDIFKPDTLLHRHNPPPMPEEPEESNDRRELMDAVRLARETERRMFRSSLYAYCKFCLGYSLLEPEVHGKLCRILEDLYWGVDMPSYAVGGVRRVLILMPRGSFKSTIGTMTTPSWILLQNDPPSMLPEAGEIWTPPTSFNGKQGYDQRILIVNEIIDNAKAFLRTNKDHLQANEYLHEVFGNPAPEKRIEGLWTANEANITWRQDFRNRDANLTASGLDRSINSGHFDFGIYDDLISQKQVTTAEQIEQTIQFYREQIPLLDKPSVMVVIGTRWHDADLYGHFLESDEEKGKWEVIIERAERTEEEIDAGKSRFFFPSRYGEVVLNDMRGSMRPDFFSAQMLNECLDVETAMFKKEYFDNAYFDVPPPGEARQIFLAGKTVVSTADPAISEDKKACYASIVTCAWDANGRMWILDVFRKRDVQASEFLGEYFRQYVEWHPYRCGIEDQGFQKLYRYNAELISMGLGDPDLAMYRGVWLPWEPLKPGGRSKDLRIGGLEPLARARKILIARSFAVVEHEFRRFPKGKYKDTIDALAYQLDLAFPGTDVVDPASKKTFQELEQEAFRDEYRRHIRELQQPEGGFDDWYNA